MNYSGLETRHRCAALAIPLLLAAAVPSEASDSGPAWSAGLRIGSDYTFRGVSQTMGEHSIQASVGVSLPSGLYAYVWGSNVDFVPANEPDDGATHEIDLAVGFATNVNDNWGADIALVRYLFPGTVEGASYDYNELIATLWYDDTYSASIGFSSNVDGTGASSTFYQLGASFSLPFEMSLEADYGYYDLSDAFGSGYSYAEVAFVRQISKAALSLSFIDTQGSAASIYGDRVTGPRLVLSLEVEW